MRVLIIDDDDLDRMSAIRAMRTLQPAPEVSQAKTLSEGRLLLHSLEFDAILLDYHLPDGLGIELLADMKSLSSGGTAVVVLSGIDDLDIAAQCLREGAQDFLLKAELQPRHLQRAVIQAQQKFALEHELRQHHVRMRDLLEHDALTGLYNRYYFNDHVDSALARAIRYGSTPAIMMIDLDNFKLINDTYGHDVGDALLKEVSLRINALIRGGDILCRLGGDEFAILVNEVANDSEAYSLAKRIIETIALPCVIETHELNVGACIGVAMYPSCGDTVGILLKHADMAMYRSKSQGRNRISFFTEELDRLAMRRMLLEYELRKALTENEFEIYYQPQIDRLSHRILSVEALLRWNHPRKGLLAPGEFMDVAEESGLILDIGQWVTNQACRDAAVLHSEPLMKGSEVIFAINLSAKQLRTEDILWQINKALATHNLPAHLLEVEVTESAVLDAPETAAHILNSLVQNGTQVALDDFGTGYSSISHLTALPLSVLKIDKSFLMGALTSPKGERLLEALLNMARGQGLTTVVEGIETESLVKLACENGADRLQGYYFFRPMPFAELVELLKKH